MTSFALDELTWPEVRQRLSAKPRLIIPVGALDQHGPHLPLGANMFIARRVTEEVSQACEILRAPSFSYGVTAGGGPFSGPAGLSRKTLHRAINELLGRWEDHGVRDFILITAHRYEPHLEALLMALSEVSATTVYDLFQIDVGDLLEGNPEYEHGGELETSLLLHLAPERVRGIEISDYVPSARALRRYIRGRVPKPPEPSRGSIGRPSLASAEKGKAVFERYVSVMTTMLSAPDLSEEAPPRTTKARNGYHRT